MPKYELLYIIGSETADDAAPGVIAEVKKAIETGGGTIEKSEDWGRRKLAYPIKTTKNGYYVLVNFSAPSESVSGIEHKIRTNQAVIRHLIVNMDGAYERMEKDRVLQSKLKPRRPQTPMVEVKPKPTAARRILGEGGGKISIDLDAEIEKAIGSEDN